MIEKGEKKKGIRNMNYLDSIEVGEGDTYASREMKRLVCRSRASWAYI